MAKVLSPDRKAAKTKFDKETYEKINIALRIEEDAEIIKSYKNAQKCGISGRKWLRNLYEGCINKSEGDEEL